MLVDNDCVISDLLKCQQKGNQMTLEEKSDLDYDLKSMMNATRILRGEQWIPLKSEQQLFLKVLVPFLIRTNEPKIAEICALYDICIDDIIKCEQGYDW